MTDPSKRLWRTLIRVISIHGYFFYFVIPGRDSKEQLRLRLDALPLEIQPLVKPGKRLHAKVNFGVENPDELYFDEWEAK